jgi:spore coat polysaccharide biosynthesis predicted glycosyltransferase SpsG
VNTLFVAVAGPTEGLGHLTRCRVLMLELARRGWPVELLFVGPATTLARWQWPDGVKLTAMGEAPSDLQVQAAIGERLAAAHIGWIVIDGYRFRGRAWREQANGGGAKLLMFDDIGDQPFAADAVLNQNNDDSRFYAGRGIEADHWLLGPKFALLDDEHLGPAGKSLNQKLERLLVVFGGADRRRMTPRAVAALSRLRPALQLDVVLGPYSTWSDAPADTAQLTFHRAPPGLAPLLRQADAVLTAAGSTVWQACAGRCPALVVQTVDNQAQVVATLRKADCAWLVDAEQIENQLPQAIDALRPLAMREALATRARELVDGAGKARVAETLMAWQGGR